MLVVILVHQQLM